MAILGHFWPEAGDVEPGFGLPVKFCAGTHRFQNFWTSVTVFRDFGSFSMEFGDLEPGFGFSVKNCTG